MTRKVLNYNILNTYLPAFIILLIFFILSIPENFSGADDAYTFARFIRDAENGALLQPRYPLYLLLGRGILIFIESLGLAVNTHMLMVIISSICGACSVILLYHLSLTRLRLSRFTSLCTAILLLLSWSFWRYSVEAEVYIPSMLMILLYILALYRLRETINGKNWANWLAVVLLGILAVLLYKPNMIPVLFCLPWLLSEGKTKLVRPILLTALIGGGLMTLYAVLASVSPYYSFGDYLMGGASLTQGSLLSSIMVALNNTVSFQWVFSINGAESLATSIWPNKVLSEEIFLQEALLLPPWIMIMLLVFLAVTGLYLLIKNRTLFIASIRYNWYRTLIIWVVLYALILLYLDPSSAEPWIMLQLPLLMLISPVIFGSQYRKRTVSYGLIFLLLLFSINLFGGMLLIQDKTYDYIYQRAKGISSELTENDILITFGPKSMEEYLAYHCKAEIINMEENFDYGLQLLEKGNSSGRIFILDDLLNPEPAIRFRSNNDTRLPMQIILHNYDLDTLYKRDQFSSYELKQKVK